MTDANVKLLARNFHVGREALNCQIQYSLPNPLGDLSKTEIAHGSVRTSLQCIQHHHGMAACANEKDAINRHWLSPLMFGKDQCWPEARNALSRPTISVDVGALRSWHSCGALNGFLTPSRSIGQSITLEFRWRRFWRDPTFTTGVPKVAASMIRC